MRIFHTGYRQRNPATRAGLRGVKKQVHTDLLKALKRPSGARKSNPKKRGYGRSIDSFNLLAQLNGHIREEAQRAGDRSLSASDRRDARKGVSNFMALRDTVSANIEGYLEGPALGYALEETLRELTAAEVRVVQKMIKEAGGEVSPEEGKLIRARAKMDPEVRKLQASVDEAKNIAAQNAKMFAAAISRNKISASEWQRGSDRHQEISESDASARDELGDERFTPADKFLWKRVNQAILQKYPGGYIPPRLVSQKRKEMKLLIEMNHSSTSASRKKEIRSALERIIQTRLRNRTINAYEKAGGRGLTQSEKKKIKRDGSQKMQELGTPFKVGPSFYGVITGSKSSFKWALVDSRGRVHVTGKATTKNSASKNIGIAFRIVESLAMMDKERAGWDELPANDRRWLESNYPDISEKVARLLLRNINKRVKVSKATAMWLAKSGGLGAFETKGSEEVPKDCKGMAVGEERTFKGAKNQYIVFVQRGIRNKYTMRVLTKDGRESQPRRLEGCERALSRGHALGGSMVGAGQVLKAISNPTKLKKLNSDARRYFAKKNPKLPRQEADVADIKELTGMFQIPDDSEDAFRYGLYFGIIRGIDTCGVQNYLKRKRIRKRYQERLLEGLISETSRAGGLSVGKAKGGSRKSKASAPEPMSEEELESIMDSLG
jgi:hypothetical protein